METTSLDWHPVSESAPPPPRTRKESNTSASRYSESYDAGEEAFRDWYPQPAPPHYSLHSDDDEASQAGWADSRHKSSNLSMPEKGQVSTRLNQIRDYISQTSMLMKTLRETGEQRNMVQLEKLASMMEGLRDSETKLDNLLSTMDRLEQRDVESEVEALEMNLASANPLNPTSTSRDRNRTQQPSGSVPKTSDAPRRNELKMRVEESQRKLLELQEQQANLLLLRQKAQEQLKEARAAQSALLAAHGLSSNNQNISSSGDANNLFEYDHSRANQQFKNQLSPFLNCEDKIEEETDFENELPKKFDEMFTKKAQADLLTQMRMVNGERNPNVAAEVAMNSFAVEECERDVRNKMEELNAMREQLAHIQSRLQINKMQAPIEKDVPKQDNRTGMNDKYEASATIQSKTLKLKEAKLKLHQLQTLLSTVEDLSQMGQPIPDRVWQMLATSCHEASVSPPPQSERSMQQTDQERERVIISSERDQDRIINSCDRDRPTNHSQSVINDIKHNNQQRKSCDLTLTEAQKRRIVEDLIRKEDLMSSINEDIQPQQNFSFQESGTTVATWGGSIQDTLDEGDNAHSPEYSTEPANAGLDSISLTGIVNTSSVTSSASQAPHNIWRKQSAGGGASSSRIPWTYQQQSIPQQDLNPVQTENNDEILVNHPDNSWVVQQISQLQNQLQTLYKSFIEKQHNCPPQWVTPPSLGPSLGPYCQYITSASQWQQQQLLVHSLNQCCQLIWHQHRELMALKEALNSIQQPQPSLTLEEQNLSPSNQSRGSAEASTSHNNLSRVPRPHATLKPSQSVGLHQTNLIPPTIVSSAHSLPNLASPQTTTNSQLPDSHLNPTNCLNPTQNRNLLATSSPTATVLSLPTTLNINPNLNTAHNPNLFFNPNSQFTDPNFINLYPPYGNNLNFDGFPSPVNFLANHPESFLAWPPSSNTQPATTLNNQVPPGNRANNYWDNFRSYSRQNLLSGNGKRNEGLLQGPIVERSQNPPEVPSHNLSRKEKSNAQSRQTTENSSEGTQHFTRAQVHHDLNRQIKTEPVSTDELESGDIASGYQSLPLPTQTQTYQHNLIQGHSNRDGRETKSRSDARSVQISSNNYTERCVEQTAHGGCKIVLRDSREFTTDPDSRRSANKRNYIELNKDPKISHMNFQNESQLNDNYHVSDLIASDNLRPINVSNIEHFPTTIKEKKMPRNLNPLMEDNSRNFTNGSCPFATTKGVRKKDCSLKDQSNSNGHDPLEECVYSEVAALITLNESRPEFLLQLFRDLRVLSSEPNMEAALNTIRSLASRANSNNPESVTDTAATVASQPASSTDNSSPQPRNIAARNHKETPLTQLPTNCAKLDWEVRSILLGMLPFLSVHLGESCGPVLLESIRKMILLLAPAQCTQEQLDGLLEDALLKFQGCRLRDVCDELVTVVADVLISELTFLRLINTVHHVSEANGDQLAEADEEEDGEGAVGGVAESSNNVMSNSSLHPSNTSTRRNKSETVSEADLAEADQSRHSVNCAEEVNGLLDAAEAMCDELLREEASGQNQESATCNGDIYTESKTEASSWAVEQDREMGLDQVPTRLTNPDTEHESLNQSVSSSSSFPGTTDPGPSSI